MTRESAYCFGADLGGTKLAAALADARGRIVAQLIEPTDPRGGAYIAEQIAACADKLARAVGIEVTGVRHVMVGVPGAVHPRTGRVSQTPNITGLEDFDFLGYLQPFLEQTGAAELLKRMLAVQRKIEGSLEIEKTRHDNPIHISKVE